MVYFEGKQPITLPALIIGNTPREIRGISLKGGRTGTGSCQIQNPFDRQTYIERKAFILFILDSVLCREASLSQSSGVSYKEGYLQIFRN